MRDVIIFLSLLLKSELNLLRRVAVGVSEETPPIPIQHGDQMRGEQIITIITTMIQVAMVLIVVQWEVAVLTILTIVIPITRVKLVIVICP